MKKVLLLASLSVLTLSGCEPKTESNGPTYLERGVVCELSTNYAYAVVRNTGSSGVYLIRSVQYDSLCTVPLKPPRKEVLKESPTSG